MIFFCPSMLLDPPFSLAVKWVEKDTEEQCPTCSKQAAWKSCTMLRVPGALVRTRGTGTVAAARG
jgi:hypothetical protein